MLAGCSGQGFFALGAVCPSYGMSEQQLVEIRLVQPGDHAQVLALASRLAEGVAPGETRRRYGTPHAAGLNLLSTPPASRTTRSTWRSQTGVSRA